MAKNVYVGVNDVAREVKNICLGVNNVSRSIKKGYIGVEGIATEFFVGGVDAVLDNNEWSTIAEVSANGQGENYWSIGDCKGIVLNGPIGDYLTLNNQNLYVYILGFNHNSSIEGFGISFGCFKTSVDGGVDVCLCDSYLDKSPGTNKGFSMDRKNVYNAIITWIGCDMRYGILGSTNVDSGNAGETTATSPVSGTLMAAFPVELRSVMKPIVKYTDNTANATNTANHVTSSIEFLPLLSEFEIFGECMYANSAEQNFQKQYDYYKNGNSKIKYKHDEPSKPVQWYTRSPHRLLRGGFMVVTTSPSINGSDYRYSRGVAPVFLV